MDESEDPVQAAFGDSEDLYDVATWDVRTRLDRFAVSLYGWLLTARTAALVLTALTLFFGLFGLAIPVVADEPVLGALGLLSIVPAVGLVTYLWHGDPTRREPLEPIAVTFVLAVLFATFAAVLNSYFVGLFSLVPGMVLYFFFVVAPVEETVKWLAVRIHAYRRPAFDTVVDGVVYGAVAGLGFAAIENLVYILGAYLEAGALSAPLQFEEAARTAFGRAFVGPGHVIYSAFAGYYLGLAKFNPGRRGPIVVKGLVIAAFIHGLYNTAVTYLPFTLVSFFGFVIVYDGLLLAILLRKVRRYRRYYDRATRRLSVESAD
jgi:RsiW-degrading membrane proteinase PrsW (M82 family)